MARAFTTDQRNLLKSPHLRCVVLMTFYLDSGTYRFCDDVEDMYNGVHTYIGASSIADVSEVRSGPDLAAEGMTITIDGNKFTQAGIADPGAILRQMLDELYSQRRVDFAFGFAYTYSQEVNLTIPAYAGKINSCRLIDDDVDISADARPTEAKLEVILDSLASRYGRATFRTRSDADQREIDVNDAFFSFTEDALNTDKSIYWGKQGPSGSGTVNPNDAERIRANINGGFFGNRNLS
jgi:hypothetical protein